MTTHHKSFEEDIGVLVQFATYLSYGILMVFGYIRDWWDTFSGYKPKPPKGYAPITRDFEEFYRRRLYQRIADCWNRPITGAASGRITVLDRERDRDNNWKLNGKKIDSLNLASYNYLGFSQKNSPCEKEVIESLNKYGISTTSPASYLGQTKLHRDLEAMVSKFLGTEESMIFGMGWGTNSTAIPALVGKGCLIISDSMNHNSIVVGARSSGAHVKTFPHNNAKALEKIIRKSIIEGQPKTYRPWRKILIIVEGVYSMEGEICDLKNIVEVKKKYKCYLYVDEAHSIGATGITGRGVCEHRGVNPKDVDILMGTFTKSFGSIGGYVSGTSALISTIRKVCASQIYSSGLSPACTQQVISSLTIIQSDDGKQRIKKLHDNSNFMRKKLESLGLHVIGDYDSAVIPVFLGNAPKISSFSRECLKRGIAVVVVGFPATPILTARARFCISASHTIEELNEAAEKINEVADYIHVKYMKRILG